jgi:metal-responsive CopG/Arc/MetJ family transcriptional regulator
MTIGYTLGMKVAVSIPDDVFKEAERLAKKLKKSRSKLYAIAIAEYLARYAEHEITQQLNRALAEIDEPVDPFVREAARRTLKRNEW